MRACQCRQGLGGRVRLHYPQIWRADVNRILHTLDKRSVLGFRGPQIRVEFDVRERAGDLRRHHHQRSLHLRGNCGCLCVSEDEDCTGRLADLQRDKEPGPQFEGERPFFGRLEVAEIVDTKALRAAREVFPQQRQVE